MTSESRPAERVLVLGFLVIVFGVPLSQVGMEVYRGHTVQSTDLFRSTPTVVNLRRYEQNLEASWWGETTIRPAAQQLMLIAVGDMGAKAVAGCEGWMFYRPGVQFLTGTRRGINQHVGMPADAAHRTTRQDAVLRAIVRFRDQLRQRGIKLLVVPVPGKASVYPDRLTSRLAGKQHELRSPTEDLLVVLGRHDVETVDLFSAFRKARRVAAPSVSSEAYYLKRDTHWTPAGAALAAQVVARKLRDLAWVSEHPWEYKVESVSVARRGDIVEMMQIPGAAASFPEEVVICQRVLDSMAGPLVPPVGGRAGRYKNDHLIDTPLESSLLLLGDSFCRIYQFPEPASLGKLAAPVAMQELSEDKPRAQRKRLLPGSAGFPSLLALHLQSPVDYIVSDGGAAGDVRQRLSVDSEILDYKKVVVWAFAERDIALGREGWPDLPLPPERVVNRPRSERPRRHQPERSDV